MDNLLVMTFAEWLKTTRKSEGVSLSRLVEKIGNLCSDAYLSKLENARYIGKKGNPTRPDKEIVIALADALHTDRSYVLQLAGYAVELPQFPPEIQTELTKLNNKLSAENISETDKDRIRLEFLSLLQFLNSKTD